MLLAIDVGNSYTTIGVFERSDLRTELRLSTRSGWTRDEFAVDLSRCLALGGLSFADLTDAIVACVVPPALQAVTDGLRRFAHLDALVVGPGIKTGMPIRYDPPQDVGADRIVTAVAAHVRYGTRDRERGIVVVDFGTAITFDVISPKPEYLGGVIAPGVGISADALFSRAAKLPRVEAKRPSKVVGRNTVAAIQSGLVHGYVGLVEGILARIRAEIDFEVEVVGTGEFASVVAEASDCLDVVDDTLVLEGLRLIHTRNRGGEVVGVA